MIYLYWGENSYVLQEKLAQLKTRYSAKFASGLNFFKFDLEEDTADLESALASQSMFGEKKLVFVRGIFSINQGEWDSVEKILTRSNIKNDKEVILIFYDFISPGEKLPEYVQKRKEFFKKNAEVEEFKNLERPQMLKWAGQLAKKNEVNINTAGLSYLISSTGLDCHRISNELGKLAMLNKEVGLADIDSLVNKEIESNIFRTTDALAQRNLPATLKSLNEHWSNNEDPLMILNMLAWQFRSLVKTASLMSQKLPKDTIAKKLGAKPWVVEKSMRLARGFSFPELKSIYQNLADADVAIKTGQKDGREALEDFVYSFLPNIDVTRGIMLLL